MMGMYRGVVANNIDPEQLGRVQVEVPEIYGEGRMTWAMPCAPYAGDGLGLFAVPPIGALVWVGFEAGDYDRPVVLGGFWGRGQVPASPADPMHKALVTDGVAIRIDDEIVATGVGPALACRDCTRSAAIRIG